jgi:hypothetical protein
MVYFILYPTRESSCAIFAQENFCTFFIENAPNFRFLDYFRYKYILHFFKDDMEMRISYPIIVLFVCIIQVNII